MLALLYPFVDLRNEFHIDHLFPRSLFTPGRLARAGVPEEAIERYRDHGNRLGNLQLLEGSFNRAKNDRLPHEWLAEMCPAPAQRADYLDRHDLTGLPAAVDGFEDFYLARRQRMAAKLMSILGVSGGRTHDPARCPSARPTEHPVRNRGRRPPDRRRDPVAVHVRCATPGGPAA